MSAERRGTPARQVQGGEIRPVLIECVYGPTGREDLLEVALNPTSGRFILSGNQPERFIGEFQFEADAIAWVRQVGLYDSINVYQDDAGPRSSKPANGGQA